MVLYSTTGAAASGLTNNTTYFIDSFFRQGTTNLYSFTLRPLPNAPVITSISGGSGTQTFSRIGISVDKDIVHIPNSSFSEGDMLEYSFSVDGRFGVEEPEQEKRFYFVDTVYDSHNYILTEDTGPKPVAATGGNFVSTIFENGQIWKVHQFTSTGTSNFVVSNAGTSGIVEYLVVAGGGAGGDTDAGGGGAGQGRQDRSHPGTGCRNPPDDRHPRPPP
jgi:hypothetical protein